MNNQPLPKKSLGQHFLVQESVIQRIMDECGFDKEDRVLEIGPGRGALTPSLAGRVKHLTCVEKDDVLAAKLSSRFEGDGVRVIHGDILDYDLSAHSGGLKIVGNLPYNLASRIVQKILKASGTVTDFYAMVQLEHGLRMTADPGGKTYGSLSCFVRYHSDVRKVFRISPQAFRPRPKVMSVFLHFSLKKDKPLKAEDEEMLFKIVRTAFAQRRKKIINALQVICPKEQSAQALAAMDLPPGVRAEDLSLGNYMELCRRLRAA